ncbi:MAG: Hint domain-containing protein [Alphaproteobacteria bacterium]|nr:Hint domain-containing protein [Alphaproteobacteria bacterium]
MAASGRRVEAALMVTIPAGTTTYTLSASGVTATNSGTRGGVPVYGVKVTGSDDTVVNTGTLLGAQAGITLLGANDVVDNRVGGYIHATGSGGFNGVLFPSSNPGQGVVINAGIIAAGPAGSAVVEANGGSVINLSTGTLSGSGIYIAGAAGTVANYGLIAGGNRYGGIALTAGGNVTNFAGGTIAAGAGPYGILIAGGTGTVTNAGTISSTIVGRPAITFPAGYADRLVWHPGAVLNGLVDGGNAPGAASVTTLELASAASVGTLTGLGTQIVNFGSIAVDAGATWTLAGSNTLAALATLSIAGTLTNTGTLANNGRIVMGAGTFAAGTVAGTGTIAFGALPGGVLTLAAATDNTIANMAEGQTIDLLGRTVTDLALLPGNTLRLSLSDAGTLDLKLDPAQDFTGLFFHHTTAGADSRITESAVPCFAEGTRVLTEGGEVAVECLMIGDRLATSGGGFRPIAWLGRRLVACARHKAPHDVWPIRIAAGAFAPLVPRAILHLSPDHAVLIDGVLIPVRYLENGTTIRQHPVEAITYWHVELDRHDVILAEGLECESYLDTGNRGAFSNGDGPMGLHPDFARCIWGTNACAPLVTEGPELLAARLALLDRAIALGFAPSQDPEVHLMTAQSNLRPEVAGTRHRFALGGGVAEVRLRSLNAVPAHIAAAGADHRRLGLAVRAISGDGTAIRLDDPRLGAGWHPPEDGAGWRWTDGDAALLTAGISALDIDIAFAAPAWIAPPRMRAA